MGAVVIKVRDGQVASGGSIVLLTAGVMHIFDAIWMFRYNGALSENRQDSLFGRGLDTYGWI